MEADGAERGSGLRRWTRAEVGARNSMRAAAIVIDNLVYEVTDFLEEHPGGAEVLLDNAGRDASQCFRDVGHSELAHEWRAKFLVGELVAAERRAVLPPRAPPPPAPRDPPSLATLLDVCAPPALLVLLAASLYLYLF